MKIILQVLLSLMPINEDDKEIIPGGELEWETGVCYTEHFKLDDSGRIIESLNGEFKREYKYDDNKLVKIARGCPADPHDEIKYSTYEWFNGNMKTFDDGYECGKVEYNTNKVVNSNLDLSFAISVVPNFSITGDDIGMDFMQCLGYFGDNTVNYISKIDKTDSDGDNKEVLEYSYEFNKDGSLAKFILSNGDGNDETIIVEYRE